MRASGLLGSLCDSLMASGVPADVLTETVCAVAEVIRGSAENQNQLAEVMAPSTPPRPALVVLLMSMVNEKQPLALRCAVLYCYQSFLHRNQDGQAQLAQTLLPSSSEQGKINNFDFLLDFIFLKHNLLLKVAKLKNIWDISTIFIYVLSFELQNKF